MQTFTGFEYLLIDIANHFGKDKLLFQERIDWVMENIDHLEELADQADERPLYVKSVLALRKVLRGEPTGHLVGFDASCSGIQIMSAITGCKTGANATGLVDPNRRADAYTDTTEAMRDILGPQFNVSRKDAKNALMTSYYGSKQRPKDIFGDDTPEHRAFLSAAAQIAPGPWHLLQVLIASWNPTALSHDWVLPDNYHAHVKVMEKIEVRIEVDELNHSTFTYEYYENAPQKRGLSNAANVVHSIDAYLLRSVHRRCNYDKELVETALEALYEERNVRELYNTSHKEEKVEGKLAIYLDLWERTGMIDAVALPYINTASAVFLPNAYIKQCIEMVETMLTYEPFEVLTVHDEFKCHPNHMNHLRMQYRNILAELADSEILSDILSQLFGRKGKWDKYSTDLSHSIRLSNYAIC